MCGSLKGLGVPVYAEMCDGHLCLRGRGGGQELLGLHQEGELWTRRFVSGHVAAALAVTWECKCVSALVLS